MYAKQKGIATIVVVAAIVVVSASIGILSQRWLGQDNPVEEFVEDEMDDAIEYELHLPENSVNIDLSPSSKEGLTKK